MWTPVVELVVSIVLLLGVPIAIFFIAKVFGNPVIWRFKRRDEEPQRLIGRSINLVGVGDEQGDVKCSEDLPVTVLSCKNNVYIVELHEPVLFGSRSYHKAALRINYGTLYALSDIRTWLLIAKKNVPVKLYFANGETATGMVTHTWVA